MRLNVVIRTFALAAVAAFALTTSAPPAEAAPTTDIWTHYYDCALNMVGEKFRGCDSTGYNWGTLSGHYREIESCSCGGTTCTSTWYIWNGSQWVYINYEPGVDC
jgi:hypothetical protein